ncbi:UNVERIFIED_CONTAM: hypothetical protein PYX00_003505 [Menopon gallinae]|uniref:Uncharacterized protein n=1 Tax=Menopon gallinae TaxID=328185 RepID=A0AAW2I0N9_9NEOP
MVEAFSSVYTKDYRPYFFDEPPEKPMECSMINPEENFLPEKGSKMIYNPQRDEEVMQRVRKNQLQSTYQVSYRHPDSRTGAGCEFPEDFMDRFDKVFQEKKTQAILRPPETALTVLGYTRFDHYYTGFTTYQDEISRMAYIIHKKNLARAKREAENLEGQSEEKAEDDAPADGS